LVSPLRNVGFGVKYGANLGYAIATSVASFESKGNSRGRVFIIALRSMAGNEVSSESKLSPTPESEKEHGDDAGTVHCGLFVMGQHH